MCLVYTNNNTVVNLLYGQYNNMAINNLTNTTRIYKFIQQLIKGPAT